MDRDTIDYLDMIGGCLLFWFSVVVGLYKGHINSKNNIFQKTLDEKFEEKVQEHLHRNDL
jgi:hypothetical protein